METPTNSPDTPPERPKASLLRVIGIVLSSFVMIGRNSHYGPDAPRITPVQLVIVGVLGGIAFVGTILTVVMFVTR